MGVFLKKVKGVERVEIVEGASERVGNELIGLCGCSDDKRVGRFVCYIPWKTADEGINALNLLTKNWEDRLIRDNFDLEG